MIHDSGSSIFLLHVHRLTLCLDLDKENVRDFVRGAGTGKRSAVWQVKGYQIANNSRVVHSSLHLKRSMTLASKQKCLDGQHGTGVKTFREFLWSLHVLHILLYSRDHNRVDFFVLFYFLVFFLTEMIHYRNGHAAAIVKLWT